MRNLRASLERVKQLGVTDTMPVQKYDIRRPEAAGGGFEERYWSPINTAVRSTSGELEYIIHRVEDVTEFVQMKEQQQLTHDLRERMEAEVFQRTQQVAEASRQLKEANAELARLYEKTKELDRIKSQFFANVSHELRTPLALILGPTERLLSADQVPSSVRHELDLIAHNARLLLKHVNDLLDASRLEAGTLEVDYAELDLAELVQLVAGQFASLAAERGVSIVLEAATPVRGFIDTDKIQRGRVPDPRRQRLIARIVLRGVAQVSDADAVVTVTTIAKVESPSLQRTGIRLECVTCSQPATPQLNTTVLLSYTNTRSSTWQRTAFESTLRSRSRPLRTKSSTVSR
jgi:signal transduction histidine kinase